MLYNWPCVLFTVAGCKSVSLLQMAIVGCWLHNMAARPLAVLTHLQRSRLCRWETRAGEWDMGDEGWDMEDGTQV